MGRVRKKPDAKASIPYRTILFIDLDHTVMQSPFSCAVFDVACGEIAEKAGRSIEEVRELVARENKDRMQDSTFDAVRAMDWDDIVQAVAARLDVPKLETSVLEYVRTHAGPPYARVLGSARKVLKRLSRSPLRAVVAATNGLSQYQLPVLEGLDLLRYFDDVLSPDTEHVLKDKREFYDKWRYKALLKVMVGDSKQYDVDASLGHGFKAIWYMNGHKSKAQTAEPSVDSEHRPTCSGRCQYIPVRSLRALPRIVRRLEVKAWFNFYYSKLKRAFQKQGPGPTWPGTSQSGSEG